MLMADLTLPIRPIGPCELSPVVHAATNVVRDRGSRHPTDLAGVRDRYRDICRKRRRDRRRVSLVDSQFTAGAFASVVASRILDVSTSKAESTPLIEACLLRTTLRKCQWNKC